MLTLTFLDLLTRGDLTGGAVVAGTGSIAANGALEAVRGAPEKMLAAHRAGASVFLLPTQLAHLAPQAPRGLEVVVVSSFYDALDALCGRPGVSDDACE
jgi:PDZ domain-containing protein